MIGGKPVWFVTSMFRTWSFHRMLSIWRWHFIWKLSRIRASSARRVHVSAAYRSVERTSALYVRILMGSDKRWSRHIFFKEAITDEARAMRLLPPVNASIAALVFLYPCFLLPEVHFCDRSFSINRTWPINCNRIYCLETPILSTL